MERGESALVKRESVDKTPAGCYSVFESAFGADFLLPGTGGLAGPRSGMRIKIK